MNILIAGDLVPEYKVGELFCKKNIHDVLGEELNNIWINANYKLFNLETPLTTNNIKIKKYGPCIKCDPQTILGIKELNPTCVLLANNHIMDYGEKGLKDTTNLLNDNGINWIGVGENNKSLKKTFIIREQNKNIGIYNCCETEFSIAENSKAGANPFDIYSIDKDLKELKLKSDYIIFIYHGGKEYYRYPSPELQKRCRKIIDWGANLVVCQHSHCIGSKEEYNNGTIVYGQGNFIFNRVNDEFWNSSVIIDINISNYRITYIPIIETENGCRLANEKEKNEILTSFNNRSKEIKNEKFIINEYEKFANKKFNQYIVMLSGSRLIYKIINKLGIDISKIFKIYTPSIINAIECEAHRELLIQSMKNKINKNK